jgi:hypothetical protein
MALQFLKTSQLHLTVFGLRKTGCATYLLD